MFFIKKRKSDGLSLKVRHSIPTYALSLDDELNCPNKRLIEIGLEAARRAFDIDLYPIANLFPEDTARFLNIWPGEHYRLLAALVEVLEPSLVIEIGTATGASCLTMKNFIPQNGRIVTYDIVPWDQYPGSGLKTTNFDSQLEQRVIDLTDINQADSQYSLLKEADLIFVDAAKDGKMENIFCEMFDNIRFTQKPIIVFDDIKFMSMLEVWRKIKHPKLDITSFGHWSGTGMVEWGG
jgi:predicted O-methyltransferase YrrM